MRFALLLAAVFGLSAAVRIQHFEGHSFIDTDKIICGKCTLHTNNCEVNEIVLPDASFIHNATGICEEDGHTVHGHCCFYMGNMIPDNGKPHLTTARVTVKTTPKPVQTTAAHPAVTTTKPTVAPTVKPTVGPTVAPTTAKPAATTAKPAAAPVVGAGNPWAGSADSYGFNCGKLTISGDYLECDSFTMSKGNQNLYMCNGIVTSGWSPIYSASIGGTWNADFIAVCNHVFGALTGKKFDRAQANWGGAASIQRFCYRNNAYDFPNDNGWAQDLRCYFGAAVAATTPRPATVAPAPQVQWSGVVDGNKFQCGKMNVGQDYLECDTFQMQHNGNALFMANGVTCSGWSPIYNNNDIGGTWHADFLSVCNKVFASVTNKKYTGVQANWGCGATIQRFMYKGAWSYPNDNGWTQTLRCYYEKVTTAAPVTTKAPVVAPAGGWLGNADGHPFTCSKLNINNDYVECENLLMNYNGNKLYLSNGVVCSGWSPIYSANIGGTWNSDFIGACNHIFGQVGNRKYNRAQALWGCTQTVQRFNFRNNAWEFPGDNGYTQTLRCYIQPAAPAPAPVTTKAPLVAPAGGWLGNADGHPFLCNKLNINNDYVECENLQMNYNGNNLYLSNGVVCSGWSPIYSANIGGTWNSDFIGACNHIFGQVGNRKYNRAQALWGCTATVQRFNFRNNAWEFPGDNGYTQTLRCYIQPAAPAAPVAPAGGWIGNADGHPFTCQKLNIGNDYVECDGLTMSYNGNNIMLANGVVCSGWSPIYAANIGGTWNSDFIGACNHILGQVGNRRYLRAQAQWGCSATVQRFNFRNNAWEFPGDNGYTQTLRCYTSGVPAPAAPVYNGQAWNGNADGRAFHCNNLYVNGQYLECAGFSSGNLVMANGVVCSGWSPQYRAYGSGGTWNIDLLNVCQHVFRQVTNRAYGSVQALWGCGPTVQRFIFRNGGWANVYDNGYTQNLRCFF